MSERCLGWKEVSGEYSESSKKDGHVRTGIELGQVHLGDSKLREVMSGQVKPRLVKSGQAKSRQGKSGQVH